MEPTYCQTGHFGPFCLLLPYIVSRFPTDAPDEGGISIRIKGYNLGKFSDETGSLIECDFVGIARVVADLIGDDEVQCQSPRVTLTSSGVLSTQLQLFVNNTASFNYVPFSFYGVCPESYCLHGFCSFGRCQCSYGYRGDSCEEELIAPQIASPPEIITLMEGTAFTYQLEVNEGSFPIDWNILGGFPQGISIDVETGTLEWLNPIATDVQTIRVQATNDLKSSSIQIKIHVLPAYYVTVTTTLPATLIRPAPQILFNVETIDSMTHQPVGDKLAVLWVNVHDHSPNLRRKITLKTNQNGTMSNEFQPYFKDAGGFVFGGEVRCDIATLLITLLLCSPVVLMLLLLRTCWRSNCLLYKF